MWHLTLALGPERQRLDPAAFLSCSKTHAHEKPNNVYPLLKLFGEKQISLHMVAGSCKAHALQTRTEQQSRRDQ